MTHTETAAEVSSVPGDPAMAAGDPAMFSPITPDENRILTVHLTSGWRKQSAVYPTLSEPWRETAGLLDDLGAAWDVAWHAEHDGPEAGA